MNHNFYFYTNYKSYEYENTLYEVPTQQCLKINYLKWYSTLTIDEKLSVHAYKFKSDKINKSARTQKNIYRERLLSSAMKKANFDSNIIVNRRVTELELDLWKNNLNLVNKLDFCSTYVQPRFYKKPLKYVAYIKILVQKGAKAAYLDGSLKCFSYEKEILLQKNSQFKFINNYRIIVDDTPKDIYIFQLKNT